MDVYHFRAIVKDPSIYEYPTNIFIIADSLAKAVLILTTEHNLILVEHDSRIVTCMTRDEAIVEYEVS